MIAHGSGAVRGERMGIRRAAVARAFKEARQAGQFRERAKRKGRAGEARGEGKRQIRQGKGGPKDIQRQGGVGGCCEQERWRDGERRKSRQARELK